MTSAHARSCSHSAHTHWLRNTRPQLALNILMRLSLLLQLTAKKQYLRLFL